MKIKKTILLAVLGAAALLLPGCRQQPGEPGSASPPPASQSILLSPKIPEDGSGLPFDFTPKE